MRLLEAKPWQSTSKPGEKSSELAKQRRQRSRKPTDEPLEGFRTSGFFNGIGRKQAMGAAVSTGRKRCRAEVYKPRARFWQR